jgi:hypothetical protein
MNRNHEKPVLEITEKQELVCVQNILAELHSEIFIEQFEFATETYF